MRKTPLAIAAAIAFAATLSGCTALDAPDAARVATGITSQLLCGGTFVSGLDTERVFAERVKSVPTMTWINWALRYEVDPTRREVRSTLAGGFESRAVFREGSGCLVLHGDEPAPAPATPPQRDETAASSQPDIAGSAVVEPAGASMHAAFDHAFAEPASPPYHHTHALLVLRDGRLVAERYASGIGPATPLLGFSATKSVTHAMVGLLVREGKLALDQPAPLPMWRRDGDPRGAITIDQLLRQVPGLDFAQTNSGLDPTSRMSFVARDKAAMAETAEPIAAPGTRWAYTDSNYLLLSRVIRDAAGGREQDVLQFLQRELFGPAGMRNVSIDVDATGTPMGAANLYASARDWARFGLLYLNDGVASGRRILPPGWVRHASTQTLDTGYGAGWWVNVREGNVPGWGVPWGLPHAPRDAFFARGYMGQFVIVVPSRRLVIVRLGASGVRGDDIGFMDDVVRELLAALDAPDAGAARSAQAD
jgi:CubicO group peptidase (beta-lactamase class C family)